MFNLITYNVQIEQVYEITYLDVHRGKMVNKTF